MSPVCYVPEAVAPKFCTHDCTDNREAYSTRSDPNDTVAHSWCLTPVKEISVPCVTPNGRDIPPALSVEMMNTYDNKYE